jgi:hypothetical protein
MTSGLLAAIAVLAMALTGPSTAMALSTALCKADTEKCTTPVSHVHYEAEDLEVLNTTESYKCDALYLANVYALGSPQVLEGAFTYSNCDKGCSRVEENGPVILHLLRTEHETAELSGTSGAGVRSECGGGSLINCVYSFENLIATVKGPLLSTSGSLEIIYSNAILTHVSGVLCPELAKLDATFTLTSPEVYITP